MAHDSQLQRSSVAGSNSASPTVHKHIHRTHSNAYRRGYLLPQEVYEQVAKEGSCKLQGSLLREAVLGFMAGVFISHGYATCMIAAGQLSPAYRAANPGIFNLLFGAFGMPMGLALCLINGASLFTSNVAYMGAAIFERKASGVRSLQLLLLSYFANIAGCLLVAQFMAAGDVFLHREHFSVELAGKLAGSSSFRSTLVKGVLGNWLLCMAVWQATAAQDVTGKLLAVMFPVSAYVTMGLEHCIANCFVYQLALKLGGPPLPPFIVNNLLACTLGNVIGGGCFVAAAYSLAFGSLEKKAVGQSKRIWRRVIQPALFGRAKNNSNSSSGSSAVNSTDNANVTSDNTGAADTGMVTERLAELAAARGVVGRRSSIRMPADVNGDAGGQVLVGAPSAPLQSLQAASEPTE